MTKCLDNLNRFMNNNRTQTLPVCVLRTSLTSFDLPLDNRVVMFENGRLFWPQLLSLSQIQTVHFVCRREVLKRAVSFQINFFFSSCIFL